MSEVSFTLLARTSGPEAAAAARAALEEKVRQAEQLRNYGQFCLEHFGDDQFGGGLYGDDLDRFGIWGGGPQPEEPTSQPNAERSFVIGRGRVEVQVMDGVPTLPEPSAQFGPELPPEERTVIIIKNFEKPLA